MFSMDSKTARAILMKFSKNLQISPVSDPVKIQSKPRVLLVNIKSSTTPMLQLDIKLFYFCVRVPDKEQSLNVNRIFGWSGVN